MSAGSFYPGQGGGFLHAMAGDDCSLHFDLDELTQKQQADHRANIELTGMLQLALALLGDPGDHLALYTEFREQPWRTLLDKHLSWFNSLGVECIPAANFHFHSGRDFYSSLAADRPATERLNLYMISGGNRVLHQDDNALAVSRDLNSKFHFARHAGDYGLPVPRTLTTRKAELHGPELAAFLTSESLPVMLKTLGLAGARNVTQVSSIEECETFLQEYHEDMPVLLQRRLRPEDYTEMTADLRIGKRGVEIANVRKILFADGLWVGNRMGPELALSPAQQDVLIKVGKYAQHHGYGADLDVNCGVDFFIGPTGEIVITEINARWTGGLFPCEALRKLGLADRPATVLFDLVPADRAADYTAFEERYLLGRSNEAFQALPLGFSPFITEINGALMFFVWQLVIDDFAAFAKTKQAELGPSVLPTADLISA